MGTSRVQEVEEAPTEAIQTDVEGIDSNAEEASTDTEAVQTDVEGTDSNTEEIASKPKKFVDRIKGTIKGGVDKLTDTIDK